MAAVFYYGDFAEDDTVNIPFNTFTSDDPSVSCTITNLADADIKVHKDAHIDQIVTDGATVVIDFDGITGNHMINIDTSVDAAYATGSEYQVRIEGTIVDGGTINAWVGSFSIERAGGTIALLKLIQAAVITNAAGADVAADIIAVKAETAIIVNDTDVIDDGTSGLVKIASDVADILTDTGSTLDTLIKDIPTTAELALRTLLAADYVVVGDTIAGVTAVTNDVGITQAGADKVWGTAARILTANTNLANLEVDVTKIHGSALTETVAGYLAAAFVKLFDVATPLLVASDVMVGTDGANTVVPDVAGTAPTAAEIKTAMEAEGTSDLDAIADAVAHGTYGLSALQVLIAALQTDLDNGTDGLGALKTLIDALQDLTAQNVRDAMKLAPTAGAPAAGSVDKHLDDIVEDTSTTLDGIVDKILALLNNKLTIVDATGGATLRNIGDSADLATWGITDDDTDTVRTEVTWA